MLSLIIMLRILLPADGLHDELRDAAFYLSFPLIPTSHRCCFYRIKSLRSRTPSPIFSVDRFHSHRSLSHCFSHNHQSLNPSSGGAILRRFAHTVLRVTSSSIAPHWRSGIRCSLLRIRYRSLRGDKSRHEYIVIACVAVLYRSGFVSFPRRSLLSLYRRTASYAYRDRDVARCSSLRYVAVTHMRAYRRQFSLSIHHGEHRNH